MMEYHADVAVVILTHDQKDVTLRCLSSFEDINHDDIDILVWDNGSTDGTREAIEERFPSVEIRRSTENLGAAGGRNAGASAAMKLWGPKFLLFLDNDTVVTPDFICHLQKPFAESSSVGITFPKILLLDDPERIDAAGGCRVQFHLGKTPAVGHGEVDRGQYDVQRECGPGGCCVLVRADVFEAVNGFDTDYDPYGFEDLDFSLRVKEAGYKHIYVPKAVIYHSPTQTFEDGRYSPEYARQKARNWYRFVQRHASPVGKASFWLFGVPLRLLSAVLREVRSGNITDLLAGGMNMLVGHTED